MLHLPDGVSDNGFSLLLSGFSRIREIDLMMETVFFEVILIALSSNIIIHQLDSSWFIIISAMVHDLNTKAFINSQKLQRIAVNLLLFSSSFLSPINIIPGNEIRNSYY